jgi:hypothetical protein
MAEEGAKWLLKRAGGRRSQPPSRRDLLSRGLGAPFDCAMQARPRLGAAGGSGPLPRGRVRDRAVTRAAAPLLHVFATFATGGPQVRFATVANRLGGRFRHAVLAMDGRQEARAARSRARHPLPSRRVEATRAICAASAPRWDIAGPADHQQLGSIEWAGADRFGHAASARGDGRPGGTRALPRRVLAPAAVAPCHGGAAVHSPVWRIANEMAPESRLRLLPNGVDLARFAAAGPRRTRSPWSSAPSPRCARERTSRV